MSRILVKRKVRRTILVLRDDGRVLKKAPNDRSYKVVYRTKLITPQSLWRAFEYVLDCYEKNQKPRKPKFSVSRGRG